MAKYRQVFTEFWRDAFVLRLTPEEKFFFLYLMTNSATRQCGIFELPIQIMCLETGYNEDTVRKLIKRFCEYGKMTISEETQEIALKNWAKYNFNSSPKVQKLVDSELNSVKDKSLIQYVYGIDMVSMAYRNNNKNNKNKENEKESQAEPVFVSLLSEAKEVFLESGLAGVFFEKMKKLHAISDVEANRFFHEWKEKNEALGTEFKTKDHLKNSFNKFIGNAKSGGGKNMPMPLVSKAVGGVLIG
jgi:hypothetical protein